MTPQPANLRSSLSTVWPPVPMCKSCTAIRVSEPGRICPQCVIMVANREQLLADQRRGIRILGIAGLIMLGLAVAALMVQM